MARIIDNQLTQWGRTGGPEPQRTDLWVVDFKSVLVGLNKSATSGRNTVSPDIGPSIPTLVPYIPPKLSSYYAQSVTLPDLKVRSEPVRRDSRPYPMPSWDEPLEAITMTFILDCQGPGDVAKTPHTSDIYQMLDMWRSVVRAGRGSMSREYSIRLNESYSINYAFDVRVQMLKGTTPQSAIELMSSNEDTDPRYMPMLVGTGNFAEPNTDLRAGLQFSLVNCWLASFKLGELSYADAKVELLTAVFYADDILQANSSEDTRLSLPDYYAL